MKFLKIDANNLPDREILAVNKKGDYLMGYLYKYQDICISCCDDDRDMHYVTHYIDLKELDKIEKE